MIASVDVADTFPAPTFWIWRLIIVLPTEVPTETTPLFPVDCWKFVEISVPLIVKADIALVAAVTDESPMATSPALVFAVAPRPNANAPSVPARATEPRVVALVALATEPRPTAVV